MSLKDVEIDMTPRPGKVRHFLNVLAEKTRATLGALLAPLSKKTIVTHDGRLRPPLSDAEMGKPIQDAFTPAVNRIIR